MSNIDDLRWIRIVTPIAIPRYLVEQVRDRDYTVDDFYKFHEINCTSDIDGNKVLNPFHHLYVLASKDHQVKGVLWFTIDPLSKDVLIQTYSVDKEYWNKGSAVGKAADHVKKIMKEANLKKAYWLTNYPKHSERYGFRRARSVLMEYVDGKDADGVDATHRKREPVDSRAERATGGCIAAREHRACGSGVPELSAAL